MDKKNNNVDCLGSSSEQINFTSDFSRVTSIIGEATRLTRRNFLIGPAAIATANSLLIRNSLAEANNQDQTLTFELSEDRKTVTILLGLWLKDDQAKTSKDKETKNKDKDEKKDAAAKGADDWNQQKAEVWTISAQAFGPEARFQLFPAGIKHKNINDGKLDITGNRARLRIANVRYGAHQPKNRKHRWLDLVFLKQISKVEGPGHWTLCAETAYWGGGKLKSETVDLRAFMLASESAEVKTTDLIFHTDTTVIVPVLGSVFGGLIDLHKGHENPKGLTAKHARKTLLSLSSQLAWSIRAKPGASGTILPIAHPAIAQLETSGFILAWKKDTRRNNNGTQGNLVEAKMVDLRAFIPSPKGQLLAQERSISGAEFHVHHEKECDFVFKGKIGEAELLLRAYDDASEEETAQASTRTQGKKLNKKAHTPSEDKQVYCEAAIAGRWDLSVAEYNDADRSSRAGPFRDIEGVVTRTVTTITGSTAPKRLDNEKLTFSGVPADARLNDEGPQYHRVHSPIGTVILQSSPYLQTVQNRKHKGSKKHKNPFVKNPFEPIRGAPIFLLTEGKNKAGEQFDTNRGTQRIVTWYEVNYLLLESMLALHDVSFSRLTFDPTSLTFLFAASIPQSLPRNFVWLGDKSVGKDYPHWPDISRISLSRARLQVARHLDLVSLKFGFEGLYLMIGDRLRIVPEGPLCGIYAKPGTEKNPFHRFAHTELKQPEGTAVEETEEEQAKKAQRSDKRIPVLDIVDSRPLLTVEFPPQHVLEEAIFRRSPDPGPDVDLLKQKPASGTWLTCRWDASNTLMTPVLSKSKPDSPSSGKFVIIDIASPASIIKGLANIPLQADRKTVREQICKVKKGPASNASGSNQAQIFASYADDFKRTVEKAAGPADQAIFVGPYAMAPDIAAIHRDLLKSKTQTQVPMAALSSAMQEVYRQFDILKAKFDRQKSKEEEILDQKLLDAVAYAIQTNMKHGPAARAAMLPIEHYLEGQVPLYQIIRSAFRERVIQHMGIEVATEPKQKLHQELLLVDLQNMAGQPDLGNGLAVKQHIESLTESPDQIAKTESKAKEEIRKHLENPKHVFTSVLRHYIHKTDGEGSLSGNEKYPDTVKGRLSKPSRLAFRINCQDGLIEARNRAIAPNSGDLTHGVSEIPFTFAGLTNWAAMELSVIARAERIYDPGPSGRLDQSVARTLNLHGAAMLDHLGFAATHDPATRKWAYRAVSIANSLRQAPAWDETAIEIPSRLVLSPSQQALFKTPGSVNDDIFVDKDRSANDDPDGEYTAMLWSAELMMRSDTPPPDVRAIHSPDLAPDAILSLFEEGLRGARTNSKDRLPGMAPPPRGPYAPWLLSRSEISMADMPPHRLADIANRNHKLNLSKEIQEYITHKQDTELCKEDTQSILADKLPAMFRQLCRRFQRRQAQKKAYPFFFRTSLDAYDRHEIVMLSSAYGLPVMPRVASNGSTGSSQQSSQFKPAEDYELIDVMPQQEIYRPRTLDVSELSLSSLGGHFVHDTSFTPPSSAKYFDGRNLFDALSIERWQHSISLGRDVHCEIVYKGYLFPLGFRASLVKVTERIFAKSPSGTMKAYLRQRMFIRCANREKSSAALGQPFEGRRFPGKIVRLLTETTPDIVDPTSVFEESQDEVREQATGRILFKNRPGLVFWPRTGMSRSADIRFDIEIDDAFTTLPLLFVDNVAINDHLTLEALARYYNDELTESKSGTPVAGVTSPDNAPFNQTGPLSPIIPTQHRRTMVIGGRKIRYADELKTGSCSLQTDAITIRVEGRYNLAPSQMQKNANKKDEIPYIAFTNTYYAFDPVLQGADQPPFYPALETTRIRLTQNAQLTGEPAKVVRATYDGQYIAAGFPAEQKQATTEHVPFSLTRPAPEEIFINLLDPVSQDMGTQGDQSGGIYRPKGDLRSISRKRGPLASSLEYGQHVIDKGNLPAMSAKQAINAQAPASKEQKTAMNAVEPNTGTTDAPLPGGSSGRSNSKSVAVTAELKPPSQNEIFDQIFGESKLCGLIKFKKIFSLIAEATFDNVMEVVESVEHGAARATASLEETAQDIRANVLIPLATLVRQTEDRWNILARELEARQKGRIPDKVNVVTLKELFPEIDGTLGPFSGAVTAAEEERDLTHLIGKLGNVYETGQRLLDALNRTAANPVERFEQAISSRITAITNDLNVLLGILYGDIKALLAQQSEELKKEIISRTIDAILPRGMHEEALFVIPYPFGSMHPLPDTAFKAINQALTIKRDDLQVPLEQILNQLIEGKSSADILKILKVKSEKIITSKQDALNEQLDKLGNELSAIAKERAKRELEENFKALTTLIDKIDHVITGEIDKLVTNTTTIANDRLRDYYYKLRVWVDYFKEAHTLWNNAKAALGSGRLQNILLTTEAFLSHISGRRISLLTPVNTSIKVLQTQTIGLIDAVALPTASTASIFALASYKENAFETDGTLKSTLECVPATTATAPLKPAYSVVKGFLEVNHGKVVLEALAGTYEKIFDASNGFDFDDAEDKIADLLADIKTKNLLSSADFLNIEKLSKLPNQLNTTLEASSRFLSGAYCDLLHDAERIAGLEARINDVKTALQTFDPNTGGALRALRSEFAHLIVQRQIMLHHVQTRLEALITALKDVLGNQAAQLTAIVAAGTILADIKPSDLTAAGKKGKEYAEKAQILLASGVHTVAKYLHNLLASVAVMANQLKTYADDLETNETAKAVVKLLTLEETVSEASRRLDASKQQLDDFTAFAKTLTENAANDPNNLEDCRIYLQHVADKVKTAKGQELFNDSDNPVVVQLANLRQSLDIGLVGERALDGLKTGLRNRLEELLFHVTVKALNIFEVKNNNLSGLYVKVLKARNKVANTTGFFEKLLLIAPEKNDARSKYAAQLPDAYRYMPPANKDDLNTANDALAADAIWLRYTLSKKLEAGETPESAYERKRAYLHQFAKEWANRKATPQRIIDQLAEQVHAILRGDIDLDELFDIRQKIETYLRNIIPSKHRFDMTMRVPLPNAVKDATLGIFVPNNDCKLFVGSQMEIDLLPNGVLNTLDKVATPKIKSSAVASLGAFDIKLVGDFLDAVTIKFNGARFVSNLAGESDFKLYYNDFKIGPALSFLEPLGAFLSPGPSGPYITLLRDRPGIEAGYGINLGTIMIGNIAFGNISLNASALLPFDGGERSRALFKASLSRRLAPFHCLYSIWWIGVFQHYLRYQRYCRL